MIRAYVLAALLAAALSGCTSVAYYETPVGLTSEAAATMVGSKTETSSSRSDVRTQIGCIDGKPVQGGRDSWERPVLVPEGEHEVVLFVRGGELFIAAGTRYGAVTTTVTVKGGKRYVARSVIRLEGFRGAEAAAWIEDEDGVRVTGEVAFRLTHPTPTVVPIIIPAK